MKFLICLSGFFLISTQLFWGQDPASTNSGTAAVVTGQQPANANTSFLVNTTSNIDPERRGFVSLLGRSAGVVETRPVQATASVGKSLTDVANILYTTNSNLETSYTNTYVSPGQTWYYSVSGTNFTEVFSGYNYTRITTPPPTITNYYYESGYSYIIYDQYGNTNTLTSPGTTNITAVVPSVTTNTTTSSSFLGQASLTNTYYYYNNSSGPDYYMYIFAKTDGYAPAIVEAQVDDGGTVYSVDLKLVINTTWDLDGISVTITDPTGRNYAVMRPFFNATIGYVAGSYNHTVIFSDTATRSIYTISRTPIIGKFIPDTSLANINTPASGTWKVSVQSTFGSYKANLVSADLTLNVIDTSSNGFRW